jgi:hypothetical protein
LTALLLLVLTGHAFIVSASHFHRGPRPTAPATVQGAPVVRTEGAQSAPLAGGHEQCLLCRLQRNLVAELRHTAPTLCAPTAEALDLGVRSDAYLGQPSHLSPPGRAPPSA